MSEWISVKDRLPDPLQKVLCVYNSGEIDTAVFSSDSRKFYDTCCACKRFLVTHWQPLPQPPQGK